jgi:four helix bundle protein
VAWQKAMALVVDVYLMTEQLPVAERYGLISQMRRAAVSIPSALAGGHARASTKEFARYISIAMGSLAEVETQVELCSRLHVVEPATSVRVTDACTEQGRILRGLKKSLDSRISARSRISP